jgi:hypothetical protein
METTILLMQTECVILQHLKNSIEETRRSMDNKLSYQCCQSMNDIMFRLDIEILKREDRVRHLQQL